MKLITILTAIRRSKTRSDLSAIINAAEERDSHLQSIEGAKGRKRLWARFLKLGIKKGNTVFINNPKRTGFIHQSLWAKPIIVISIKTKKMEIVVAAAGSSALYTLSPGMIYGFHLSLEPNAAALAASLDMAKVGTPRVGKPIQNIR